MRRSLAKYCEEIEKREIQGFQLELFHLGQLLAPIDKITSVDEKAILYVFCMHQNSMNTGDVDDIYQGTLQANTGKIFPERNEISQDIISYWHKMAQKTKNLALQCRCLDLVVDFTGNGAERNEYIHEFIESSMELINSLQEVNFVLLNENGIRALRLATFSKDKEAVASVLSCLVSYAERCPQVACYIFMIVSSYGKSTISSFGKKYTELFNCLVTYINEVCDSGESFVDPFRDSVASVCDYYKKYGQDELLRNIIAKVEVAYRSSGDMNSSATLKVHYLQELYALCSRYLEIPAIKKKHSQLIKEITDLERQVIDEMHVSTYEYRISPEEQKIIERDTQRVYYDDSNVKRTLLEICRLIHISPLCPPKQHVDNIVNRRDKENPLSSFLNNELLGVYGIPIGVLRHDEKENRVLYEYAQYVKYMEPLYQAIMSRLVKEFRHNDFESLLINCPLVKEKDEKLCKKVVEFFWIGEYIGFSVTVLPLIESMFRELNRLNGQPIIKAKATCDGGYEFLALGTLCDNDMTKKIFGEDFVYFCKVILLSNFGWNIRNNFSHGLQNELFSSPSIAYRLMYILMILCLVEQKNP